MIGGNPSFIVKPEKQVMAVFMDDAIAIRNENDPFLR